MNWIHIHEELPESGEEVLAYSRLFLSMPAEAENASYAVCTYCRVGDVLFNEKRHEPIDITDDDLMNSEAIWSLLLDEEEYVVEREGFYYCEVDSRGLLVWQWLATCDEAAEYGISHWCHLDVPEDEVC